MKRLMRTPIIFDGRNQYEPEALHTAGFEYVAIGRANGLALKAQQGRTA